MTNKNVNIGGHVLKAISWNPKDKIPEEVFEYIDLSSIDKDLKKIDNNSVSKIKGIDAPSRARQKIQINDILVSTVRPNLNGVALLSQNYKNGTASTGYCVLRAKSELYHKYLFYWVQTKWFIEDMTKKATGANYPAVSDKIIKDSKIPLPPLETQKKIAAILDAANEYRQHTKALIEKYDLLAQALFLDMFGDPVTNPKGWGKKRMEDACTKVTDGTHDTPERLTKGIKFITGKHIRPYSVDYENSDYVTIDIHKEIYRRCNPEKGDILYTNIGVNLGTAALNVVEYEFSMKNVALLKPKPVFIHGRYLEYFLNSKNMKAKIVWMASIGGAQQFLSLKEIRNLAIIIPPFELQNQFAERIQLIEQQKQQAKASLQKTEDLFNSLLQRAFKGELVS